MAYSVLNLHPSSPVSVSASNNQESNLIMLSKLHSRRSGFTLVEIMIVVAIIALLAAIAVPSFLRARKRSQATAPLETLRMIDGAKDQYAHENAKASTVTPSPTDLAPYVKNGS